MNNLLKLLCRTRCILGTVTYWGGGAGAQDFIWMYPVEKKKKKKTYASNLRVSFSRIFLFRMLCTLESVDLIIIRNQDQGQGRWLVGWLVG